MMRMFDPGSMFELSAQMLGGARVFDHAKLKSLSLSSTISLSKLFLVSRRLKAWYPLGNMQGALGKPGIVIDLLQLCSPPTALRFLISLCSIWSASIVVLLESPCGHMGRRALKQQSHRRSRKECTSLLKGLFKLKKICV